MSNLFKIPRGRVYQVNKVAWDLVRQHGKSRRAMVAYLCNIGGYSAGYNNRFAIEFNISAHAADLDADHLWDVIAEERETAETGKPLMRMILARRLFNKAHAERGDQLWSDAVEDAFRNWSEAEFTHWTFANVVISDWDWEVHGRGGKHLCLIRCGNIRLTGSEEDLEERLMERDTNCDGTDAGYLIDVEDVKKLFLLCVHLATTLTPRAIADAVEYQAAWSLWFNHVSDELDAAEQVHEERANLRESANLIRQYLSGRIVVPDEGDAEAVTAFDAIANLADIGLE